MSPRSEDDTASGPSNGKTTRVVHVLTRLLRAGSEENTIGTCRAQAQAGYDVFLIHGRDFDRRYYETLPKTIQLIGIDSLVHPLSPVDDCQAFVDLMRLFRRLRPDIVHTHQSKAGIIGRFAARATSVPSIVHGVHIAPFANAGRTRRFVYLLAEKAAATITDAYIDVSRGMRDAYIREGVGRPDRHHVVHSGFDLSRFRNATVPDDWRTMIGIGEHESRPYPIILMLAAFEPRKRHCEFLAAFPRVLARHPQARLLLCGEGPHRSAVEATVSSLGLQHNVRLIGYRTDPEKIIALADLCILTSTREGLPRVVMQYLCSGKACVASNLPGLEEVLHHEVNGLVTDPDDMDATADTIADLLSDKARLEQLSRGARGTDLTNWEVGTMCRKIEQVYQETMNRKLPRHNAAALT